MNKTLAEIEILKFLISEIQLSSYVNIMFEFSLIFIFKNSINLILILIIQSCTYKLFKNNK